MDANASQQRRAVTGGSNDVSIGAEALLITYHRRHRARARLQRSHLGAKSELDTVSAGVLGKRYTKSIRIAGLIDSIVDTTRQRVRNRRQRRLELNRFVPRESSRTQAFRLQARRCRTSSIQTNVIATYLQRSPRRAAVLDAGLLPQRLQDFQRILRQPQIAQRVPLECGRP